MSEEHRPPEDTEEEEESDELSWPATIFLSILFPAIAILVGWAVWDGIHTHRECQWEGSGQDKKVVCTNYPVEYR